MKRYKVKKSQGIQENILIINIINNELIAAEYRKISKINTYVKRNVCLKNIPTVLHTKM